MFLTLFKLPLTRAWRRCRARALRLDGIEAALADHEFRLQAVERAVLSVD